MQMYRDGVLTWDEFLNRGKDLALWVLETRRIPEGKAKDIERACRLYYGRVYRPRNLEGWLDENQPLLSLLESAQKWPEKEKGFEFFNYGPFAFHNVVQHKSLSHVTGVLDATLQGLIKHPKFATVLYGDILLLPRIQKKHAGWYSPSKDKVYVFRQEKGMPSLLEDLTHELGHRYWYRHMTEGKQQLWTERYKQLCQVVMPPEGQPLGFPFQGVSNPIVESYMGGLVRIKDVDWFHIKDVEALKCATQFPTHYASFSVEEFFAETFSRAVVGDLQQEHRDFLEWAT